MPLNKEAKPNYNTDNRVRPHPTESGVLGMTLHTEASCHWMHFRGLL